MDDSLQILIKKSLELYDIQNEENKIFIKDKNIDIKHVSVNNINFNEIEFNTKKQIFNYEILGIFYLETNIWVWSWCAPFLPKILSNESRKLFNYSFKDVDKDTDKYTDIKFITYVKSQFTNSKILFKNKFELDIFLSICSYLLQNKIKFVYPKHVKGGNYITYYLIK